MFLASFLVECSGTAKKQVVDLQSRLEYHKTLRLIVKAACAVLVTGSVCACIVLTAREFAGRTSFADMTFKFIATAEANKPVALIVAYVLTFISGGYGLTQRWLRRRYIEKWAPMLAELEASKDPKRSSSSITRIGTTRQEDL